MEALDPSHGTVLTDGSRLIIESVVIAGADVFVGYPITPANLLYLYATQRFPAVLSAPDEITTLQWMSGLSAAGRLPVTATSFPGYALMIESINMAWMMELPMLIILAQRLGPATGTATCGAQGDLSVVAGTLSGGYTLPTFCISRLEDCWSLSSRALQTARDLRSPVVLLTSKEMTMTTRSFDLSVLTHCLQAAPLQSSDVSPLKPVGADEVQVRFTASTHDEKGIIQSTSAEALANTLRIQRKVEGASRDFSEYELDEQDGARILVLSYDITAEAARDAICSLRAEGVPVSLLIAKSLLPVPSVFHTLLDHYPRIVVAEENSSGELRRLLFGDLGRPGVSGVNAIGRMITPDEIREEALR